jgi:ADP-heptose:LPS heptosyltransferase
MPHDLISARNILFILPEDGFELLHQVENITALSTRFCNARKIIVCQQDLAAFGQYLPHADRVFSYDKKLRYAFSPALVELRRALLKEYIDISFFLEQKPDLSLHLLNCQVAASIRVGYHNPGNDSFFNVQIKNSSAQPIPKYRQNLAMAELLGAEAPKHLHWTAPVKSREQLEQRMKQSSLNPTLWIGGIDLSTLYKTCTLQWLDQLLTELNRQIPRQWYGYIDSTQKELVDWCAKRKLPCMQQCTIAELIALIARSGFFITGKSACFKIAELVHTPALGLFPESEQHIFSDASYRYARALSFSQKPDEVTRTALLASACTTVC